LKNEFEEVKNMDLKKHRVESGFVWIEG